MSERILKIILILIALLLVIPFTAEAQIVIKRSIRPGNTSVIHDLSTNAITISGSTLTATNPFPDSIGVGDAVQYDSSNSGAVTSIAFLHSRTSSTVWTVKRANGAAPSPCTADTDGDVFAAYTSISNYVAGTENTGISATVRNFDTWTTSLITTTQNRHVVCYPGTDTSVGSFNSWDSNSTYKLEIYTPEAITDVGTSQRHQGKLTGRCYLVSTADATGSLRITGIAGNAYNVTITGLQIKNTVGDGFHDGTGNAASVTRLKFDSCIFIGSAGTSTSASHSGFDGSSTQTGEYFFSNCVFYGWSSSAVSNNNAAVHMNCTAGTAYAYNCSDYGSDRSFAQVAGTFVIKNSIGNNTGGVCFLGSFGAASNYNISKKTDAPGANSKNATVVAWVDSTNGDFHLKSTDTAALNAGMDLSGDSNLPFTSDIDRGTRPDITLWDIGPDEQGVAYGISAYSPTLRRRRAIIQ